MPIDLNDPLTNTTLALGGGLSLAGSAAVDSFISKNQKALANWDKSTRNLWKTPAFKSEATGKWLQVSPEMADTLLDNYVTNAHKLSTQRVGPLRTGNLVGDIRLLPTTIKNMFSKDKVDIRGDRQHYRMFSDPDADLGKLKAHMLDVGRETDFLDGKRRWQMRDAYSKLSQEAKDILSDSSSIKDKYTKLNSLADKSGLNYIEDFILGHGHEHPGTAKLVGGGIIGKIDPKTGKISDEVIHSGFAKNYMHYTKKPLEMLKRLNKVTAGAKGATTAVGLFGLGNLLGKELSKSASVKSAADDNSTLLGLTELGLGGGLTAVSGDELVNKIKQLIDDRKKAPNLNVGFNYGDLPEIGDGHKAPAKHIRQVLERYIESLPDGHELKGKVLLGSDGKPLLNEYGFAKREGGVQFHDLAHKANGITPAHAEDFNIIYNTGLGAAVPSQFHKPGEVGHKAYGYDNAVKLKGTAQSLKHYVTDTPQSLGNKLFGFDIPNYGVAAAGPGSPVNFTVPFVGQSVTGHGYGLGASLNSEVLGYGAIPDEIKALSARPFIAGSFTNLAPEITGTPFINPTTLDNMNKYDTKEKKLARLKEIIDNWDPADTSGNKAKLSKIYDAISKGKRVVTIAGSGRGDYVGNRTAHMLDSLDRLGVNNVEVIPLMGGYTGSKDVSEADRQKLIDKLELADKKGRLTTFGRLDNEPYTLLQQLADINMASTGQMAISEAANAGNLQFIPEAWGDLTPEGAGKIKQYQIGAWKDILTDQGRKPTTADYDKIFAGGHPNLDAWNGGSMKSFPKTLPDVFKQMKSYDGPLRTGAAQYLKNWGISDATLKNHAQRIDTDSIAELLTDANKGKLAELSRKAYDAAARNRAHIDSAQKALAGNMVDTLKANVKAQKLKALPGVIGNAIGTGIGAVATADGIRRLVDPSNYKFNFTL